MQTAAFYRELQPSSKDIQRNIMTSAGQSTHAWLVSSSVGTMVVWTGAIRYESDLKHE
jgi:hypothetical protein